MTRYSKYKSWTDKEDIAIAVSVLDKLRKGVPASEAFEELAIKLERSKSAVQFRWYSKIAPKYKDDVEKIKNDLKVNEEIQLEVYLEQDIQDGKEEEVIEEVILSVPIHETNESKEQFNNVKDEILITKELTISDVIDFLSQNKELFSSSQEMNSLRVENAELVKENTEIKEKYEKLKADYKAISDVFTSVKVMIEKDELLK
ncbi:gp321 [Bacillus phage G]|uniref:Gp321 n=1 Tax=Bacillus phage G TaxID=2884420 RepID=G3MA62_9CAUD|nr:gp321 [Bacillus phage G]AEO93580.1 gp321 [Bacillus phage G]